MSGIEGIGGPGRPRAANRAASSRASGFALPAEPSETSHSTGTVETQETSLASILTLQELGGGTEADRRARKHGQDMLAALADLQRGLLGSTGGNEALRRLAELAASVPLATDQRLAAAVSAIMVRVRVELARRQE